jgi:hypothetical protein
MCGVGLGLSTGARYFVRTKRNKKYKNKYKNTKIKSWQLL